MHDDTKQPDRQTEQTAMMIRGILTADGEALGCEDCFELLDRCADLIEAGQDIAEFYPAVKKHLDDCECCKEEFEGLLAAMDAVQQPGT
jgi:hypothetical protein